VLWNTVHALRLAKASCCSLSACPQQLKHVPSTLLRKLCAPNALILKTSATHSHKTVQVQVPFAKGPRSFVRLYFRSPSQFSRLGYTACVVVTSSLCQFYANVAQCFACVQSTAQLRLLRFVTDGPNNLLQSFFTLRPRFLQTFSSIWALLSTLV